MQSNRFGIYPTDAVAFSSNKLHAGSIVTTWGAIFWASHVFEEPRESAAAVATTARATAEAENYLQHFGCYAHLLTGFFTCHSCCDSILVAVQPWPQEQHSSNIRRAFRPASAATACCHINGNTAVNA